MLRFLSKYSQGFVVVITITSFVWCYFIWINLGEKNLTQIYQNDIKILYNYTNNGVLDNEKLNASGTKKQYYSDNWRNLSEQQVKSMSILGRWLLSMRNNNDKPDIVRKDRNSEYLILIWKYGPFLERRHLKRFTSQTFSPWENCSVQNCRLSYESGDVEKADAILFHLHKIKGLQDLPENIQFENRTRQRWVFLTDESPIHTFMSSANQYLFNYNGLFNWSMSYRMDSDVPVPYGRTVLVNNSTELTPANLTTTRQLLRKKTKLVAIMGSNCGVDNQRWSYVAKLKSILGDKLDIYGRCLGGDTKSCPGHISKDCQSLASYKFYLAFENSNCREYFSEKPFWHGYEKYSIPVIFGASKRNCKQILPPNSYIHVDDFANPNSLADYLLYLDKTEDEYLNFHQWRNNFLVLNEHGYFGSISRHYCRLCEALNYNDLSSKVYNDLEDFWNPNKDCW